MKAIPYFLAAALVVTGAACSSTNTAASETATGGATTGTTGTRMGTDMNPTPAPDANSGLTPSGAATSPAGAGAMGSASASADVAAFTSSFATMQDPVFLMNAASSDMMEVRLGQMAAQKATKPEVRKFAQMMVSQHGNSSQELKAIATPLGVKMPQTMMPVHQALADRLMDKRGKDFDDTYLDIMQQAHKMDIAMFEVKSQAAETPSVQAFATKTLSMLHSHETMVSSLGK